MTWAFASRCKHLETSAVYGTLPSKCPRADSVAWGAGIVRSSEEADVIVRWLLSLALALSGLAAASPAAAAAAVRAAVADPLISRDGNVVAYTGSSYAKSDVFRGVVRDIAAGTSWTTEDGSQIYG